MTDRINKALEHPDKPGAGAAKRRELDLTPEEYYLADLAEFKRGTLRSGSGQVVTKRSQALAIAHSEGTRHRSK